MTPKDGATEVTTFLPVDIPRLRDRLATFVQAMGIKVWQGYEDARLIPPASARVNARAALETLKSADLYYVDANMIDLAESASRSMPSFLFAPEDVPARHGFVYLAKPLAFRDKEARSPLLVRAVAWAVHPKALLMTAYADRDTYIQDADPLSLPSLVPASPSAVVFGEGSVVIRGEVDGSEPLTGSPEPEGSTFGVLSTLKAIWLLMTQTLAEVEMVPADRRDRRRAQREGRTPPQIRIIKLRRSSNRSDQHVDRDWHHQWLVRGHWRMQPWGPKRERVRPVWIAPHVKGPEGKPMLGGEKVYHLAR